MGTICFTDEQRSLIEADVSMYVDACPGAGKTQAIVERFITRSSPPSRQGVALLSFTNAAVDAAKARCVGAPQLLQSPNFVGTIDSFINRFVVAPLYHSRKRRAATFCGTWSAVPGTRISVKGIKGSFELDWFHISVKQATLDVNRIPSFTLKSLARAMESSELEVLNREAFSVWSRQVGRGMFDSATARLAMSRYLENADTSSQMRDLLGARFADVIVDEAQDCSREDVLLLDLLRGAGARIVLVGDPEQGIYGFRGGSATELASLRADLQRGRRLNGNFRSSPAICAAVDSIRSTAEKDVPCGLNSVVDKPVYIIPFTTPTEVLERSSVVLRNCHVPDRDAIVLAHAGDLARACAGAGSNLAHQSNRLVRLAQSVHSVQSEESESAANRIRCLNQVARILRELGTDEDAHLTHSEFLAKHGLTERSYRDSCLRFVMQLSGPYLDNPRQFREQLGRLADSQKKLAWSTKALRTPSGNKWPAKPRPEAGRLAFGTIHSFKGLQAPGVILVIPEMSGPDHGANDWINGVSSEARRVLYVGASRAQRVLILAVHETLIDQVTGILARDTVPFAVQSLTTTVAADRATCSG